MGMPILSKFKMLNPQNTRNYESLNFKDSSEVKSADSHFAFTFKFYK